MRLSTFDGCERVHFYISDESDASKNVKSPLKIQNKSIHLFKKRTPTPKIAAILVSRRFVCIYIMRRVEV